MEMSKETRDRIFAAADQLYEQGGRDAFPTVDAVRKHARVNMNDASAGMKEWRRAQTAQAAPIAVKVPEAVQQAGEQAVAIMWQNAQELANESLRAAQAGWDAERALIESVSQQTSQAFDEQAQELEAVRGAHTGTLAELESANQVIQQQAQELADLKDSLALMTSTADQSRARAEEIERRANDLRSELDHAHQAAQTAQAETDRLRESLEQRGTLIEALRDELATVKAHAEANIKTHQEYRDRVAEDTERAAEQLKETQQERNQLKGELAVAKGDLEKVRIQAASLRSSVEQLGAEGVRTAHGIQVQLDKALQDLAAERGAASAAQKEAARLQGQVDILQSKNKTKQEPKA